MPLDLTSDSGDVKCWISFQNAHIGQWVNYVDSMSIQKKEISTVPKRPRTTTAFIATTLITRGWMHATAAEKAARC